MRQQGVQERTAEVRTTWSLRQRMERARATEKRCQELLSKLGLTNDRRGPSWAGRAPVAVAN